MLIQLLKHAVIPPLSLILLGAAGLLVKLRWPRPGRWIVGGSLATLILLMVPWVAAALLRSLQSEPALRDVSNLDAGAIVVLAADFAPFAAEFGAPDVGPLTQERLRYAAFLSRTTEIPLLVSGGVLQTGAPALAKMMATSVHRDFRLRTRWQEGSSLNTRQNARLTAKMLGREGVQRVLLVTHAWHMPRARSEFEAAGLEVIPAPTAFHPWPGERLPGLIPSARSLQESAWAIHEWIGRAWYAIQD